MRIRNDIRKRANRLFFIKVTINTLLIIIGAVCITLFLRNMQHRTSLSRQWQNSQLALKQVTSSLNQNSQTAEDLSSLFHDGNQDMLDDLQTILSTGRACICLAFPRGFSEGTYRSRAHVCGHPRQTHERHKD